jgi:hypothetical protein
VIALENALGLPQGVAPPLTGQAGNYALSVLGLYWEHVVYSVFPKATAPAALRVVGCETGGTFNPWARNRRSGAAGYFQVIARWHPWVNLRRLFEPFSNARVAYRISHGGRDWSAWECKP